MCREIGSHFHPSGKRMTPSQTNNFGKSMGLNFVQKPIFAKFSKQSPNCRKFKINVAKKSQNRGKFLIFGKYMGPI